MSSNCLKCGGTGKLVNGDPCPDCAEQLCKEAQRMVVQASIPSQYQIVNFKKEMLSLDVQKGYGEFMENLMKSILINFAFYEKNILICSRPNTGKTIWAYTLIKSLAAKGYQVPDIQDIVQLRETLNYSKSTFEQVESINKARCLIVRIPADVQFWMIDIILYIIERRVPNNGFTIFLFNGSYSQLEQADRYGKLEHIKKDGAWHTIKVEDFCK